MLFRELIIQPYNGNRNKDRKINRDDIYRKTADQPKSWRKVIAKRARKVARRFAKKESLSDQQ